MSPSEFDHDFKNQIGLILGFIELLLEQTPATDERHEAMLEVRAAAQSCLTLVDRVKQARQEGNTRLSA